MIVKTILEEPDVVETKYRGLSSEVTIKELNGRVLKITIGKNKSYLLKLSKGKVVLSNESEEYILDDLS